MQAVTIMDNRYNHAMPMLRISAPRGRLLFIVILLLSLAACRESAGGVPIDSSDGAVDISLALEPTANTQLVMGPFAWDIVLADDAGAPITGAAIAVRGDMNHAGMVPVEATAVEIGDGLYRADFEWTMAGDWIVTVTAALPDGRIKTQSFDFSVATR